MAAPDNRTVARMREAEAGSRKQKEELDELTKVPIFPPPRLPANTPKGV